MTEARGFIVAAWDELRPSSAEASAAARILMTGRLDDGRSFAVLLSAGGPAIFVALDRAESAIEAISSSLGFEAEGASFAVEEWSDLEGHALARLALPPGSLGRARRALAAARIELEAVDRRGAEERLSALGIDGPVLIKGEARPGRRVDLVFVDPELAPDKGAALGLRWLALDIETDREGGVTAFSLAGPDGAPEAHFLPAEGGERPEKSGDFELVVHGDEASLLRAFARRVVERDPDVLTGWNVLDFDFKVLASRYAELGIPFDIGRVESPASWVERTGRRAVFDLPGRAAIDAMRLVRGSGERHEELSLEAVAREILGEGKLVASRGEAKIEELERLRREEPLLFCAYCLRDSELVMRILDATGLHKLTAARAALTGVPLDLAWTSIPAFERIYGSRLRARRVAPPEREDRRVSGAAGGTVLEPAAGLFGEVMVFDFRSLYPSIMRTFNVDPLAHARAGKADDIVAPNQARFSREAGIVPELIAVYSSERERALEAGDEVGAYVYKILQNSFYGVLGAEGCRYARTELAGAITSFGKKFLLLARDFFEERNLRVIYGDTDSIFALPKAGLPQAGLSPIGLPEPERGQTLMERGSSLAIELNALIGNLVREEYGLPSWLKIRCEKIYERFFIPRLRAGTGQILGLGALERSSNGEDEVPGEEGEGEARGRAKGYAGLLRESDGALRVEVKGMEAVRSDFTPLARRFQRELLARVFSGEGEGGLSSYCRDLAAALRRGELDGELAYRKSLRRPVDQYATETPQVRAAKLLGMRGRGRITYVMTRSGAEPLELRSDAPLDYEHYVERQLLPIARSVAEALGLSAEPWLADRPQIELDFGFG